MTRPALQRLSEPGEILAFALVPDGKGAYYVATLKLPKSAVNPQSGWVEKKEGPHDLGMAAYLIERALGRKAVGG